MKKIVIIILAIVVLAVLIFLNVKKAQKGAVEVDYAVVKRDNLSSIVRAEGELKARKQVSIGADVMGRVIKIFVQEGDRVEKGDTLCLIDPKVYEAKVKQVKARLEADLARLKKLKSELERSKKLLEENLIAPSNYEEIEANYEAMRAQVLSDSFALEEALEDLKKTVITSPINGEVVAVHKEEGEMVVVGTINTPGSVIMELADRSKMYLNALVDETEITKVKLGDRAKVKVDAFPDTVFLGHVERIGGVPETGIASQTLEGVNYPVEISIEGSNHLLYPGMSASADIIVEERESVAVVPLTAVGRKKVKDTLRDVVFKVVNGVAKMTPVKLGMMGERFVEIIEGVSVGDTILTGPFKTLRTLEDGTPVKLKKKKEKKFGRRMRKK